MQRYGAGILGNIFCNFWRNIYKIKLWFCKSSRYLFDIFGIIYIK
jgi:hypothetical protein